MHKVVISVLLLVLSPAVACVRARPEVSDSQPEPAPDPNGVEAVLNDLQNRAARLETYQCKLDYVVRQPILESQSRRKGVLYYARFDDRSYLRIDFNTLQYDDEKEQKYREQYLFDGVWLTYVSYEARSVQRQQLTEPNDPVDAFALVSRRVPILGFAKVEELTQQFDIERVDPNEADPSSLWHLHMNVKPDSIYRDDYVTIDFWIDKEQKLPRKVTAITTEQDIHEITLVDPRIDKEIPRSLFDMDIPTDFSVETIPLDKNDQRQ